MSKQNSKFLATALIFVTVSCLTPVFAQRELAGAAEAKLAIDRLRVCASVLMIAAHPDDENTAVLAYFARGRKVDTAYLSLTRGEGGQNLIGPELGERLGVIRTQELLDARRIDGAQQFFSRAIDFGFTKTADETLQKWGRERILADIVWRIRLFKPDVIVLRFSGTPRDGHGQHQTSAILGKEAFTAAADPHRFPEQLTNGVEPWQATRLLWNAFAFTREQEREAESMKSRISVDPGAYDPVLGFSYGEIAGMSRSMHRSQAMGSPERKGSRKDYFVTIAGDAAKQDIFDGIETTWARVPGAAPVAALLDQAAREYEPAHPEKSVPALAKARPLLANLKGIWAERKLRDLDEAIALCAGIAVDATAEHANATAGAEARLTATAIRRESVPAELMGVAWTGTAVSKPAAIPGAALGDNVPWTQNAQWRIDPNEPYTQPYWLREPRDGDVYRIPSQQLVGLPENPPLLAGVFRIAVAGTEIEITRPVVNRYVDRVYGERWRPFVVAAPVAIAMPEDAVVFPDAKAKRIEVGVRSASGAQSGTLRLEAPKGWRVSPDNVPFTLRSTSEQTVVSFEVTPPSAGSQTTVTARATVGGHDIGSEMVVIDYPHIPTQTLFPPASSKIVRADVKTLAHRVGYVMGAGDEVPEALRQIGIDTTLLSDEDLARGNLTRFDAIVTGVRAWNTRADLRANAKRLWEFANNGGTVVVQYNVLEGGFGGGDPTLLRDIGPFPIETGRERVTLEEAPVRFPNQGLSVLHTPNEITEADFQGWVQERGLYFASKWDPHYQPVFESHDPGEKPLEGGTLFAPVGKGAYVFTAFSWFRQLPAGVPGAYRVFANFVSAGRALQGVR